MTTNRIRKIKRFIKISVASGVLILAIVLGFFVENTQTFENANMNKWLKISETQRINTVNRVVKNPGNQDLLLACVDKIAKLPDSNEMMIREAISLCYNGIKLNENTNNEEK